jgi:sugar lactone lactonase YvrE
MSKLYAEQIDESNDTVSTIFTSNTFTALPLFVPWVQPPPIRKYRLSFSGDSSSFIENIVSYWCPEVSIVNISNYTQPSNKYNLGAFWNFRPGGHIFIMDSSNNRLVQVDDMTGTNWATFGSAGSGINEFSNPHGIAIDTAKKIYITDSGNNRIAMINNISGVGWTTFGSHGSGINQFNFPVGIVVDTLGRIYIADSVNNRIVRINDMTGAGWTTLGTFGSGINQFDNPQMIALDLFGNIYVADKNNGRIVMFTDMTGTGWTTYGTVTNPIGVWVDSSNLIYFTNLNFVNRMDNMSGAGLVTLTRSS